MNVKGLPLKRLNFNAVACAATVGVLALLVCHRWFGPDLWFHIAWGREILRSFQPAPQMPVLMETSAYGNQYWLYQILMDLIFEAGGVVFVTLVYAGLWITIASIWIHLSRVAKIPVLGPVLLILFFSGVQLRLEFRPETISFLFISIFLLILSRPWTSRNWAALLILQILWTNCHSYFIFGPLLVLARALSQTRDIPRNLVLLTTVLAVTFLNPFGYVTWQSLVHTFTLLGQFDSVLEEITPTYKYAWWVWPLPAFWFCYALVAFGVIRDALKGRERFAAALGLAALIIGLRSFRFIPMFVILAAPTVGQLMEELKPLGARIPKTFLRATLTVLMVALTALAFEVVNGNFYLWTDSGTTFGLGLEWAEYPIGAVDFLKSHQFRGTLFNLSTDGGYLEYYLPEARIVCDSNYTDINLTKTFFKAENNPDSFQALDHQFHFDGVLTNVANAGLVSALIASPAWVTAYSDSHRLLFLKRDRFASLTWDLSEGKHYAGEDLRRYSYRSTPELWMGLAFQTGNLKLARQLVGEFAAANVLPSPYVKMALRLALGQQDPELVTQALESYRKILWLQKDPEIDRLYESVHRLPRAAH